jgi:Amt family ammonium transporter
MGQLVGSVMGAAYAFVMGLLVYGALKLIMGIKLSEEDEVRGADLSIHKIGANPESEITPR